MKIATITKIKTLFKIYSIGFSLFFLIMFIGESKTNPVDNITIRDALLLFFIPFVYTVGAILLFFKENIGSIIILGSVFLFNLSSFIFEKGIRDFDFFFLIVPAIIILIINCFQQNNIKSEDKKL